MEVILFSQYLLCFIFIFFSLYAGVDKQTKDAVLNYNLLKNGRAINKQKVYLKHNVLKNRFFGTFTILCEITLFKAFNTVSNAGIPRPCIAYANFFKRSLVASLQ